jgi:hypothetical protein
LEKSVCAKSPIYLSGLAQIGRLAIGKKGDMPLFYLVTGLLESDRTTLRPEDETVSDQAVIRAGLSIATHRRRHL